MRDSIPESAATGPRVFATTHWSVVTSASKDGSEQSLRALETLCHAYWYPVYAYVRRKGHGPEEAQDLTQEFFSQLIAKDHFRLADPNKGRFRGFLLATLDYFLAREWNRAHRQKRGGQFTFVSLDAQTPEERYRIEATDNGTPERRFLRQWALAVLEQAMLALKKECETNGKGILFHELKPLLSGERDTGAYAALAQRLAMTEGAIRVAVHRLRHRYGELLRNEVAQTVSSPTEVDEEMGCLLSALSD
jgi:DNA-directed RNA polymerase specialized sigma24 family protein